MWHCDVYAQKKLLFHLFISQREWIYLKKIVSRATLMNWNIAMKCWNPKIIFSESIVIIQHALEKIQKTKRLSVNCKNMKIPLNERAKRTKKNRMTWRLFKRDYGWWKCSFSTIRQILCQWNSPEEICTKCKNNPVSFHPKILHSQRGSTFFFFIYFSLLIFLSLKIYRKSLSHKK